MRIEGKPLGKRTASALRRGARGLAGPTRGPPLSASRRQFFLVIIRPVSDRHCIPQDLSDAKRTLLMHVQDYIRTIPDFPHKGIMFRDVTTLFGDPRGFRIAVDQLLAPYAGRRIDHVVGLEARGFILGGAVAHQLSAGFVPVRKKGKLPAKTLSEDYTLEYGQATVEIHDDALQPGDQVLLVDDLLATGGTAEAGIKLIERLGAEVVGCAFVIDLPDLGGRARLEAMDMKVHALCQYAGD
jgi:adenine phosphoribosyltransferase